MPPEEPTIQDTPAQDIPASADQTPAYEPIEEDGEWLEDPAELPRRPRRRLLTPVPLALLAVLLIACGFIAGVLVEKGQSSTSSSSPAGSGASLASRFAALRGGGARGGGGAAGGAGAPGSAASAGASAGQVAYVAGSTLYVTNAEGNTIKVATSAATNVTKSVKATIKAIHPGETVAVTGATDTNGAITAESIRVGAGAVGGGLAAPLGGSGSRSEAGAGANGGGAKGGTSGGAGGEPALFGKGG
jgi:hypothetical protein